MDRDDNERRRLGKLIGARAKLIEARWLERVSADVVARTDVQLTHLRDGMPNYLAELSRLLAVPVDLAAAGDSWVRIAREHGITRVRAGFDIEQLVHEFVILRNVIEEIAADSSAMTTSTSGALADLVDAAISKSIRAYVETRDYDTRRRQAEGIGFLIHELRNPLANAMTAAASVRQRAVPDQTKALDQIDRAHHRLNHLIDSVLLTEKLEAGKLAPRFARVRIGDLVESATVAARQAAANKGLELEVHCTADHTVEIDLDMTRSALQNLVDNAVKYTDSGRVEVVVEERDDAWSVHVRDDCPGLSPEELRTVFEPFQRGSTSKKGTGLGLAIARRAIEAQGGSIHAESHGPSGCHFWFELPRRG